VDADVEAADIAPRDDRTDAPQPDPAETVEGPAHELADATSESRSQEATRSSHSWAGSSP